MFWLARIHCWDVAPLPFPCWLSQNHDSTCVTCMHGQCGRRPPRRVHVGVSRIHIWWLQGAVPAKGQQALCPRASSGVGSTRTVPSSLELFLGSRPWLGRECPLCWWPRGALKIAASTHMSAQMLICRWAEISGTHVSS